MQQNFHVDIETAGTNPGDVVLSIAACVDTSEDTIHVFLPAGLLINLNFSINHQTILWHEQKNPNWEALKTTCHECPQTLLYLYEQLDKVNDFFERNQLEGWEKSVWMKSPSFDSVLLRPIYEAIGMKLPWEFREERDVRTIEALAKIKNPDGCFPEKPEDAHDALVDAKFQMEVVSTCKDILGV